MSGHEDWEAASYLGSSTRKIFLAQHHLRRVSDAVAAFRPEDFFADPGPSDPFIDIDADGDGCVLQLFGAFDAFSCAAAWHFRLGGDLDRFSLVQLAKSPPPLFAEAVGLVERSDEYRGLSDLRHRAAHRGVVSQKRRLPINFEPKVVSLYTDDGQEVISLLDRLGHVGCGRYGRPPSLGSGASVAEHLTRGSKPPPPVAGHTRLSDVGHPTSCFEQALG